MPTLTNRDFFFCYDRSLYVYLHSMLGIPTITTARHMATNIQFWMFEQCDEVSEGIEAYRKIVNEPKPRKYTHEFITRTIKRDEI